MTADAAGYSGTPLAKKLGFRAPMRVRVIDAPPEYRAWLGDMADGVDLAVEQPEPYEAVHLFTRSREDLAARLTDLRNRLAPAGMIWVSWPKRSSGVESDVTEDVIRDVCLPLGLVDVKVCAVTDVYSGLKLVIRRELRR